MVRAGSLAATLVLALSACDESESARAADAGGPELVLSDGGPLDWRIDLNQCNGCNCCTTGRYDREPPQACLECGLNNVLAAHGISYEGAQRFQTGSKELQHYFRLSTGAPVRLKVPADARSFGITLGLHAHGSTWCLLALTAVQASGAAHLIKMPPPSGLSTAIVSRENGEPLGSIELSLDCEGKAGEISIYELWLNPMPAPKWPEPVETLVDVESLPAPTQALPGKLLWEPAVPLKHGPGLDPTKVALAVMAQPDVRKQLGLTKNDTFKRDVARDGRVALDRYYLWRGERLPVVDRKVTVLLRDGYRLASIEATPGPPIDIPARPLLSEEVALSKLPPGRTYALRGLAILDGRLSYETDEPCRSRYIDAFNGKVSTGRTRCVQ
nr:hypothetical protein [uncultured bacterium]